MAHDWGVPSLAGTFGVDCPEPASWQLGRDSVYTALLCALAGTDITIGLGMLKASTVLVPEQILFDDEIYHSHRILSGGLDIGIANLALDLIESVGPGGHYLAEKHTRRNIRERWIPDLTHPGPSFDGKPVPAIRDRAKLKLEKILSQHQPPPLDKNIQSELNALLAAAERELGM
jgi:trimethylamine--corrinoid protein Co-methyltransferase